MVGLQTIFPITVKLYLVNNLGTSLGTQTENLKLIPVDGRLGSMGVLDEI
jgi:hypothetical protein